ncbi:MAG: discoidin domain-containing protein [Rariglobus sp.]
MRLPFLFAVLPLTLAAAPSPVLTLGNLASESAHEVSVENTEVVSGKHPALWITSVRASAYVDSSTPAAALDGDITTSWNVTGKPAAPNWIELDLNRAADLTQLTVHWLGNLPYRYKIYEQPSVDLHKLVHEGMSRGQDAEPEVITLPSAIRTLALRIEFATATGNPTQGIREVRLGDLPFPDAYPPAAYKDVPVEVVTRPIYIESERLLNWPSFNFKIPVADGGIARRILPRADAFEGGRLDFTLPVTPKQTNWITLKVWESQPQSMTRRGNLVVLQTLEGDATEINRTFRPKLVTEEQPAASGLQLQPGRWSYVHFELPSDLIGKRKTFRLRLLGVGNLRRDYPMRAPSPPIYTITSALAPVGE